MQTISEITQPQPCHEPWANMNSVENGRFCNSCNKTVVDFTTMTNQQIIDHLSVSVGNTCGRISASQFNEVNLKLAKPLPVSSGIWKHVMLTLTMLASLSYVKGQTGASKVKTEQTPGTLIVGEVVTVAAPAKYMTITGVVTDNKGAPIEQATVSAGKQMVLTNANGTFRLTVPEQTQTFQVRFIGWEPVNVKVNKKTGKLYKIKMKPSLMYLGGLAVVKQPGTVKAFYQTYLANVVKAFLG